MGSSTGRAEQVDAILIGAGIMSATLATMIKTVAPHWTVRVFESRDAAATESSDPWNNAGTGHSAFCELNYTPETADGGIDTSKALVIADQFEQSRQLWAFLVRTGQLDRPSRFINSIPHMSFVEGPADVEFLRKRHAALTRSPLFAGMEFSDDRDQLEQWLPLMFAGRERATPVAATSMGLGTDVDYGALTGALLTRLKEQDVDIAYSHRVKDLERGSDGAWTVTAEDTTTGTTTRARSTFVFVGAGGAALPLLQRTGIAEVKGLGGFPGSGQFLRCTNPEVVARHHAKVYGKPALGAPPMSMPHLDTRVIGGQRGLMFGPYAGFTPKFLKEGSLLDLPRSVRPNNIIPMMAVGRDNLDLVRYMVSQVFQSRGTRFGELEKFVPEADSADWELITAGQRVQVIEKDRRRGGVLQFGTKVVTSADGSVAGLLGASPGASTAVPIMLDVLERCFPEEHAGWLPELREMIPSAGLALAEHPDLLAEIREDTSTTLGLDRASRPEPALAR
ncbi:malate dehydrogenase (quinone) [Rhodococcus aerolatus]